MSTSDKPPVSGISELRKSGLQGVVNSIINSQRTLQGVFSPIIEAQNRYTSQLDPILKTTSGLTESIRMSLNIQPHLELFNAYSKALSPYQSEFEKNLGQLTTRMRTALVTLGKAGWYLHPGFSMSNIRSLEKALIAGELVTAEQWLVDYYTERKATIRVTLEQHHPK